MSGRIEIPASETACRAVASALQRRLADARQRYQEVASRRTSGDRIQVDVVEILLRWFINGREEGEAITHSRENRKEV